MEEDRKVMSEAIAHYKAQENSRNPWDSSTVFLEARSRENRNIC
jgi:hypothetical protein